MHFSKLAREITAAARGGRPDPDSNPRLRTAIQTARAANMPKDNIARAQARAREPGGSAYETIRYEGFGPGGIGMIVEALTDNRNRTSAILRSIFTRHGGQLGESNSVANMFDQVGEILYPPDGISADAALEAALEAGAQDCQSTDEGHAFFCDPASVHDAARVLEETLSASAASIRLAWRPRNVIAISGEQQETLDKILAVLDDEDDVQHVYFNADVEGQDA